MYLLSGHVSASQPSGNDGVIVVLHSASPQHRIVETGGGSRHPQVLPRLKLRIDLEAAQLVVNFQTRTANPIRIQLLKKVTLWSLSWQQNWKLAYFLAN